MLLERALQSRVCIVDDGSTDDVCGVCKVSGVHCIRLETNRGKGGALRAGFSHCMEQGAEWIITMDADGQHAVSDLEHFLGAIKAGSQAGIIIGARSRRLGAMPPARIFSNTATSAILSRLTGCRIRDSQSGYRAYASRFLRKIDIAYSRFEMESEVIIKACFAGFDVSFVDVQTLYCSRQSHISHCKDTLRWLKAVFATWRQARVLRAKHS